MKEINKTLRISALLLFLLPAVNAQSLSEKKSESVKNEVDAIFQEMVLSGEKLDYVKLSSGVNDKHQAGFIINGKYYARFSSVMDDMKSNAQGISHQDITVTEKNITVLSEKNVLLTASGKAEVNLSDGRIITSAFHWSFIYEKIDNAWKVIYSHQSLAQ